MKSNKFSGNPEAENMGLMTRAQEERIHFLGRRLGLTAEDFNRTVQGVSGMDRAEDLIGDMERTIEEKPKATKNQVKMLHTLKNRLGIEEQRYREFLWDAFAVKSTKSLLKTNADGLIRIWKRAALEKGVWEPRTVKEKYLLLDNRIGYASATQLAYIEKLWEQVSKVEDEKARQGALRKFTMRTAKVSDLRFLTEDQAGKVINALKAMKRREGREK